MTWSCPAAVLRSAAPLFSATRQQVNNAYPARPVRSRRRRADR